jgi:transposase
MRATRDLLRRRVHLMRKRAERFADPAVQKSIDVDLALIGHYDELLRDVERSILNAAKQRHSNTRYLLRTVPGIGELLSLVLL